MIDLYNQLPNIAAGAFLVQFFVEFVGKRMRSEIRGWFRLICVLLFVGVMIEQMAAAEPRPNACFIRHNQSEVV
ncbi:hypothetical protein [Hoeflea alexandrii]